MYDYQTLQSQICNTCLRGVDLDPLKKKEEERYIGYKVASGPATQTHNLKVSRLNVYHCTNL